MRINLRCPYQEKDQAKSLGAKWDSVKRTWFIIDVDDLTPFMRWISHQPAKKPKPMKSHVNVVKRWRGIDSCVWANTGPKHLLTCCCNVLPWEDCIHTAQTAKKVANLLSQSNQL